MSFKFLSSQTLKCDYSNLSDQFCWLGVAPFIVSMLTLKEILFRKLFKICIFSNKLFKIGARQACAFFEILKLSFMVQNLKKGHIFVWRKKQGAYRDLKTNMDLVLSIRVLS